MAQRVEDETVTGWGACRICGSPMVPHDRGVWCSVYGHHREANEPWENPMMGQEFDNARRVVLLVEVGDRQYGWEVLPPNRVSWEMTGMVQGSTHARVCATGEFHRLTREAFNIEIDEIDEPKELEP